MHRCSRGLLQSEAVVVIRVPLLALTVGFLLILSGVLGPATVRAFDRVWWWWHRPRGANRQRRPPAIADAVVEPSPEALYDDCFSACFVAWADKRFDDVCDRHFDYVGRQLDLEEAA
jgi:hypothetical protein